MSQSPSDSFQDSPYNPLDEYWQNIDWGGAEGIMGSPLDQSYYGHNDNWSSSYDNQVNQRSEANKNDPNYTPEDGNEYIDYGYNEASHSEGHAPTNAPRPGDESDEDDNGDNEDDAEEGWWADEDEYTEGYDTAASDVWNSKENLGVYTVDDLDAVTQTTTTDQSEHKEDPQDDDPTADEGEPHIVNLGESDFLLMRSADVYEVEFEDRSPDVLPDPQYHPDHPEVRTRINALYDELAASESQGSPSSTPMPYPHFTHGQMMRTTVSNVQGLVNRLVRDHLPQFWRHRSQDPDLNKFNSKAVQNSRPHKYAMFASCVDCGYKFHKQPLYDCSAAERQKHRGHRRELMHSNVVAKGDRGAWRPRKEIKAVRLFEYRIKKGHKDNLFMSQNNIDNVLNNNRGAEDYDGNLDYIGVKEEGHPPECPRNRPPKKSGTKLHFGWEIAVGHDHSSLPIHPHPSSSNPSNSLFSFSSNMSRSFMSFPSKRIASRYYPARSIMAAFAHILPQCETLAQNKLRKLFAYFVWHPWFDCDLQAMTIRSGYRELWPLILLRDEDPEVTAVEADQYRQLQSTSANAQRKKRKASNNDFGNNDSDPSPKKTKTKWVQIPCSKDKHQDSNIKVEEGDDDQPCPCDDESQMSPDEVERERLLSLEQRFTTMFNIGLMCHGVVNESRNQSSAERARVHRQVSRGWVLRSRPKYRDSMQDDSANDGDNDTDANDSNMKPRVKNVHKIYEYTARRDDGNRKSPYPRTRYNGCFPLMKHKALTRPHLGNALELLEGYLPHFFVRAEIRRQSQGFVLPEYMTEGKVSKSDQSKGKARKARSLTRSSSPEPQEPSTPTGLEAVRSLSTDTRFSPYQSALRQRTRQGAPVASFVVHSAIDNPQLPGSATSSSTTFSPIPNMSMYPLAIPTVKTVPAQSQPPHSPHFVTANNPLESDLRAGLLSLATALPQTLFDPNQATALSTPNSLLGSDMSVNFGDNSAQSFQRFNITPSALNTIAPSEMHMNPIFDFNQGGMLSQLPTPGSTPASVHSPVQNPLSTFAVSPSNLASNALFSSALPSPQPVEAHGLQEHQSQRASMVANHVANLNMNEASTTAPSVPNRDAQQHGGGGSVDMFGVRNLSDDEIRVILEASMGGWTYNAHDKI